MFTWFTSASLKLDVVINQGHSHTAATNRTHGYISHRLLWHPSLEPHPTSKPDSSQPLTWRTGQAGSQESLILQLQIYFYFLLI